MPERVSGFALASVLAGSVFLYAGIKGKNIAQAVQYIIQGKSPTQVPNTQTIQGSSPSDIAAYESSASSSASATGSGSVSDSLSNYSNSQLQALWIMAGGNPAKAGVAACIAQHESSGNPKVTSANPDGGTNVGLWQLDTLGKGQGYSIAQLQDPVTNARVAIAGSSNGNDWSAWATAGMCGVL